MTERDLRAHLRRVLPRTSLPRHVVVLAELPLADTAKVDRAALVDLLEVRLARAAIVGGGRGRADAGRAGARRVPAVALAEPELPAEADFLCAGGRLAAGGLAGRRAADAASACDVGVQDLFEHPTAAAHGRVRGPAAGRRGRCRRTSGRRWTRDALAPLPGPLAPADAGAAYGPSWSPGRPASSARSWRTSCWPAPTARVLCLARAADDAAGHRPRRAGAAPSGACGGPARGTGWTGTWPTWAGPALGLTPRRGTALAADCDLVLHAGALVNFLFDYRAHRAANVLGTTELLRLA